jgi:hypothetical protein
MTNTSKPSVLRNLGDFLRKEVNVKEVLKDLAAAPGKQQRLIRPAAVRFQASSCKLRPETPRGRLLHFPAKRRVGT